MTSFSLLLEHARRSRKLQQKQLASGHFSEQQVELLLEILALNESTRGNRSRVFYSELD